jgi:hypothetical protein
MPFFLFWTKNYFANINEMNGWMDVFSVPTSPHALLLLAVGCCHIRIPIPIYPNPMLFGLVKFIYYKGQVIFFLFAFLLYLYYIFAFTS